MILTRLVRRELSGQAIENQYVKDNYSLWHVPCKTHGTEMITEFSSKDFIWMVSEPPTIPRFTDPDLFAA